MTRTWPLALCLLAACAVGHVKPNGDVYGFALGHARLEAQCDAPPVRKAFADDEECRCACIRGGALSKSFAEFLATAASAVGAYFGIGAL